jgi:hypothetical protein
MMNILCVPHVKKKNMIMINTRCDVVEDNCCTVDQSNEVFCSWGRCRDDVF